MKQKISISLSLEILDWLKKQNFNISGYIEACLRQKINIKSSINDTENIEMLPTKTANATKDLQGEIDAEVNKILGV